ncbi:MAG TPA: 2Fe-2S iron-sulfur cluster-binding protein [Candidatus Nitrosotalea sp.]|nr:2Fe-2S iron-sulfur cluster-binding protein [Candidatus Nitrosotalea sp.]
MSSPPQSDLVTLTIDGRQVSVPRGTLVVEAARRLEIEVPVFCYHHKLDPVGACRLCLVEISPGPPKPATACTTPVAEGMVVKTNSAMAVAGRADILEYELVNHPLDCPVCDKGGECPLQDFTFRHGYPTSQNSSPRLHFRKPIPLSNRIALDRERCVLCYRCTRYYDEIAWEQELTSVNRGAETYIATQFDQPLTSLFSGNIIDLCPVGALTSRVWRFESRSWDMASQASVCSKCAVGCNVTLWQRRNQLVRITSRENDAIDDGWICDRGRFEYTDVNRPDRPRIPLLKGGASTWVDALDAVRQGFEQRSVGLLLPPDATNEELFLIQRLVQGPWSGARISMHGRTRISAPLSPTLAIADLDRARTIVVIASDTREEAPVLNLRIKKAVSKRGANLILVNAGNLDLDRWPEALHVRPQAGATASAVTALGDHPLLAKGPVAILYGDGGGSEDMVALESAVRALADATEAGVMPIYRATNERGALALGLEVGSDLEGCEAVLVFGQHDPDSIPTSATFRVYWDSVKRPEHDDADVFLPAATFAETQGSLTSLEGRVQFLRPVIRLRQPQMENWEVLLNLLQRLGQEAAYPGIFALQRELAAACPELVAAAEPPDPEPATTAVLYGPARP